MFKKILPILAALLLLVPSIPLAGERVVTVGGNQASRPIGDFMVNISEEYYVNSNDGDDGRRGLSKETAVATLDYAIGLTTANQGDIIYVLPGHAETITSAITCDKAGVTIIGLGHGKKRPAFTCNAAIDTITVTAANVKIQGLYFPESTLTGVTSRINIAAANCMIDGCLFECGQYDLETITITAAGDDAVIQNSQWTVVANSEADAAIEIEAAGVNGLQVKNCYFDGGNDTIAWDVGAINSGVAHTNCLIQGNVSLYGAGIIFSAAATGVIADNYCAEGTLGSMIDPGSCMCFRNFEEDAGDEHAREFPTGGAS
jgi:hypothetical protein